MQQPRLPGAARGRRCGPRPYLVPPGQDDWCGDADQGAETGVIAMGEDPGQRPWRLLLAKRLRGVFRESVPCRGAARLHREPGGAPSDGILPGGISTALEEVWRGMG